MKLDTLFSPMKIGTCEIPNRLVVPAMVMNLCTYDGMVTDQYIAYMEEKAKGGFGLLITEDYCVQPAGKGYSRIPGFWKEEHVASSLKLTDAIHKYDSKIFAQMYHPGRQTTPAANGGETPVAPSPTKDPMCAFQAREMTVEEIHKLVADFGIAARRAKDAGFDGIELHCAHGYLLAEFLSPAVNRRVDEYGGCFDNRVRIVDEILAAMREQVGPDFPIQVRLSSNDFVTGGRTEAESYELCRHFEEIGFDAIHVSNGMYASHSLNQIIAPMFTDHALNMERAAQIKSLVDIPVILANRINDPKMADTLLKMGKADFIGMARGSLADPHLPEKAKAGRFDAIRYCIGCLQGCEMPLLMDEQGGCLVNPRCGREFENDLAKVAEPKRVMVIGGGPAGLIAAETLAIRGHKPEVFEACEHLGGQFRSAAFPSGKGELTTFVSSLRKSLEELEVPEHLGCEVDDAGLVAFAPDAVIIATGAKPLVPSVPGIDGPNVATAEDVLLGKVEVKDAPIVVCGGGEVGCETAEYIAHTLLPHVPVTVLEMQDDILNDMMPITKVVLIEMMVENGVAWKTGAKVKCIEADGVVFEDAEGEHKLPAGQVISGFGYRAYNPLEEAARKVCDNVQVVGSAIKAGNALTAGKEAYAAGLAI
ncbi:MAG: FAD-dependent oxidoreductase [Atopobiaceae bacterium]|nr:FAD-dependent oxidoreductase [Atopobiaceae bacterium]